MPNMWVIVHAASGLALGALVPLGTPWLVLVALLLHLVLDLVPHWDYTRHGSRRWWGALDVMGSFTVVATLTLLLDLPSRAIVAALVSALPDLDVLDALLPGPARRRLFPSHWARFPHGTCSARPGIAGQVVLVLVFLAVVSATSL